MDQFYRQVVQFQNRCRGWFDQPSSATARSLDQEIQRLEDDAQVGKNPASLEGRVRTIISLLEQAGRDQTMDHHHADELIDQAEAFRQTLRKM